MRSKASTMPLGVRIVPIVLCLGMTSCLPAEPEPDPVKVYYLALGSADTDFDADDTIKAGGDEVGGRVTIYINGNPVTFHQTGGTLIAINEWLKTGENTVSIRGDHTTPLYLKIVHAMNKDVKGVVLRKKLDPDQEDQPREIAFECDREQSLWINDPANALPMEREQAVNRVGELLERVNKAIADQNGEAVSETLGEGLYHWQVQAYDYKAQHLPKYKERVVEHFASGELRIDPIDVDKLKYVWGRSAVLVYTEVNDKPPYQAILSRYHREGRTSIIPAFHVAYREGQWYIWRIGDVGP